MWRARAACRPSKMTAAGSAPDWLAMIGTPIALGPHLQLFARRRAKGVAGGEHDAAPFGKEPVRQLADGRGLAGAVDADDQNDIGFDVGIDDERLFDGLQNLDHRLAQGFEQGVDVVEFLARDPAAQAVENARRRLHPRHRR